jgi:hypothetical protein
MEAAVDLAELSEIKEKLGHDGGAPRSIFMDIYAARARDYMERTGALRLLAACAEHKLEGIVSKRVDRPYRSGPSSSWIKVKCREWRRANQWRHEFFARRHGPPASSSSRVG